MRSRRFWSGSENLGTPLFPLGKHHKRPLLGNTANDHFWGNTTNNQFLQDFSVQPFLNGTKIIVLLQYVEKSCKKWSFVVFPQKWSFVVFPQSGRLWCFPKGNKGVFRTTGDRGRNFFGGLWIPYGYPKFSDQLQNRRLLPLKLFHIERVWSIAWLVY